MSKVPNYLTTLEKGELSKKVEEAKKLQEKINPKERTNIKKIFLAFFIKLW